MNDLFLQNLLSENKRAPNGKLVAVVANDEPDLNGTTSLTECVEEQSTMEMMMAAYQEAKNEKVSAANEEVKRTTVNFGGGFKKGFLGGGVSEKKSSSRTSKKSSDQTEKDVYLSWIQNNVSSAGLKNENNKGSSSKLANSGHNSIDDIGDIPTIRKNNRTESSHTAAESLRADVQQAMIDDEPPMLKQLKQGGEKIVYVDLISYNATSVVPCI